MNRIYKKSTCTNCECALFFFILADNREEKIKNSNGGNGPTMVITKKYVLDI